MTVSSVGEGEVVGGWRGECACYDRDDLGEVWMGWSIVEVEMRTRG